MAKHYLSLPALLLAVSAASALDLVTPDTKAPAGLDSAKIPQLLCLGFDDNFYADGVRWVATTLFKDRYNPTAKGNRGTFDGTPMRATFFATSDGGQAQALREAYDLGFEVGNHTKTHQHNLSDLNYAENYQEIGQCSRYLVNEAGMPPSHIYGFRTPFLAYSVDNASFKALRDLGFLYDCTLDNGTQGSPKQYALPYFPGTMDKGWIWYTNLINPGLWQLPSAIFLAPGAAIPSTKGFDSNVWPNASSGSELLNLLKTTLDWHYHGTRAPLEIGLHSDYYTGENTNSDVTIFKTTYQERRQAIIDFLNYVQTLPDVRVVPMVNFIRWMRKPTALDDLSRNGLYAYDTSKVSANALLSAAATGTGITASLAGGKLAASGTLDATGKLAPQRLGDAQVTLSASLGGYGGMRVTYVSGHPLTVTLAQSDLEASNASYTFGLPSAPQGKTVSLPLSDVFLEQPRTLPEGAPVKPLDLSKVGKIIFSPMLLDDKADVSFNVTDVRLFGTGTNSSRAIKKSRADQGEERLRVSAFNRRRLTVYVMRAGRYALSIHASDGRLLQSLPERFYDSGYQSAAVTGEFREGFCFVRMAAKDYSRVQRVYAR
jgi:peptidoglycan/xylan/chitin deacetylase (PgdA/CDA1 family)